MRQYFIFLKDIIINILFSTHYDLFYVVENANWVIDEEGKNNVNYLNKTKLIKGRVTSTCIGLRNKIIHFGSIGTLVTPNKIKKVHKSNKIILSWFHIVEDDKRIKFIPYINLKVSYIHTASNITKNKLINLGIESSKIILIPLGVNLSLFKQVSKEDKKIIRQSLGVPSGVITIGSFQKDGDGWGEGMNPKLIKGPDIFCDVIEKLSLLYPIHVILTGPARGYVIQRLRKSNVSFTHSFLSDFYDIIKYYQALDLYLICSREEGGPKALVESMATGVPVVSTRVGMSPDVIRDGFNGFLVDIEDRENIFRKSREIISDNLIRTKIIENALQTIQKYSDNILARRFYEEMYKKLLK